MKTASILGLQFDALDLNGAVDAAMRDIEDQRKGYVVTPNAEIAYLCRKDDALRSLINQSCLTLPDGVGVVYAAKILGQTLHGKVAGIDFAESLAAKMASRGKSLFLLGAKPGVAEQAAQSLQNRYPKLIIKGCKDGYFKSEDEAVAAVNAVNGVDVVFVCLGAPRQEQFMARNMERLNATLLCGLGGSLDVFAGNVKRAPDIFIRLGLEWFYRLCKEPHRLGRMMSLPKYMLLVIKARLFGDHKKGGTA